MILLYLETDRATPEPAWEVTGYGLETVGSLLERVAQQELGLSGTAWEVLELEFCGAVVPHERKLEQAGMMEVRDRGCTDVEGVCVCRGQR